MPQTSALGRVRTPDSVTAHVRFVAAALRASRTRSTQARRVRRPSLLPGQTRLTLPVATAATCAPTAFQPRAMRSVRRSLRSTTASATTCCPSQSTSTFKMNSTVSLRPATVCRSDRCSRLWLRLNARLGRWGRRGHRHALPIRANTADGVPTRPQKRHSEPVTTSATAPAVHLAEQVGTDCTARRPRTTARSMTTRARRSRARRAWTALGSYQPRVALARGLRIRTARKGTRALGCKHSPLANEAIVHATIYLSALVRQLPATCNKLGRSSVHGTCQPPAMPGLRQCILAYTLYMVGSYMCFANTSLSSVQAVHSTCLFPLCC